EKDYTVIVRDLFVAARCGGIPPDQLQSVPAERFQVKGLEGDGCSAERLLQGVDKAIEKCAWAVFVFHGIGGGHRLSCALEDFEQLLQRLSKDDRLEVKTFLSAAKIIWH
ncbi:MAG: hypothetical protein PHX83_14310, partial [Acidobacteriia bacterium]|nr:hypothetical protein [Terriglobia bacterium]